MSYDITGALSYNAPYGKPFCEALEQAKPRELVQSCFNVLHSRGEHDRIKLLRLNAMLEKLETFLPPEESDAPEDMF